MAQVATNGQKATMRKQGQWSEMYAAILFPHTIYSARLDTLPTTTDRIVQIAFTSGSGTLSDVKADMTLWVGTSAGGYDLGICRIRKAPIAGTFYIGEQSAVDWQASCYLTVVDDFNLFPKHVYMDNGVPKMDYDIAYSNQHTVFNPIPRLGPMVRVKKLTGTSVNVQLGTESGYASSVFGSTISSVLWVIPDATAIDDDTSETPIATFNSVGWHICYCTVTATAGSKTKMGVRWVYIWDDDNLPFEVVAPPSCEENKESGGGNFSIALAENAALTQIPEAALCVLFSIDHYGDYLNMETDTVGDITDAENIEGIGRIVSESITYDSEKSQVSFDVQGYQEIFKSIWGFPMRLDIAVNTPDAWTDMPALTVDRALWHFLEWRCTATTIMDINLTDDTKMDKEIVSASNNLWSQLEEIALNRIFAEPVVDKYGRLFVEVEPQMVPEADRDFPVVMTLTKDDFWGDVEIEKDDPTISQIDFSGVAVNISGGSAAFFSLAPGHIPLKQGSLNPGNKYLVVDQDDSNQQAGLLLGWLNNKYKPITMNLLNNKMITCFPRQFVEFVVEAADTIRSEALTINLIPVRRSLLFDPETGHKYYQVEFEAETQEQNAVTGDTPEGDAVSNPGFVSIPDFPFLTTEDISESPTGPPVVLMTEYTDGILYSDSFNVIEAGKKPQYVLWNTGIDTADIPNISIGGDGRVHFFMTPSGSVWVGIYEAVFKRWLTTIYYAPSIGARFVKIVDQDWLDANEATDAGISGMGYNPNKPEEVMFIAGGIGSFDTARHIWMGDRNGFTQKALLSFLGQFASQITYGAGEWGYITSDNGGATKTFYRFAGDGSSQLSAVNITNVTASGATPLHKRAGTSKFIIAYNGDGDLIAYSTDGGAIFSDIDTNKVFGQNFALQPDGNYMMANWDAAAGQRGKSSDAGTTWASLSALVFAGYYTFAYCGGLNTASRWIAARAYVKFSDDFGDTWDDREGNLNYLLPFAVITKVIVPGYHNG